MEARLQKILAQWGIASRREAEEMMRQSRVCVNGVVAHLGQKVDPSQDKISIDGQMVRILGFNSDNPGSNPAEATVFMI